MSEPGSPRVFFPHDEDPEDHDQLGDGIVDEEDDEGEDLFGDGMAADYERRPELDQYDPDMIDDSEHNAISVEERLAAERSMNTRDGGNNLNWRLNQNRSPSEDRPSASQSVNSTPDNRAGKRRRMEASPEPAVDDEDAEGDTPQVTYDLTHETLPDGTQMEKRLEMKIQKCFEQFLRKFTVDGHDEPRYPDFLRRMAEEHEFHLDVSFLHLQQWSSTLALWIADHPLVILPLLNETLMNEAVRKFKTYELMKDKDENELRVAIHSFPVLDPIRDLNTKHLGKLIFVTGVVTKRSAVRNQVKRLYICCAKCSWPSGPFDVCEEKDLKPGSCIECQSKGPWYVDRQKTLYRNHQTITLQETPSSVEPGKMPRSKEVVLTGDQVDKVRPGDELHLTGVYKCIYDALSNARTCFPVYKTEIESVHSFRKGDVKLIQITDEQTRQIHELARQPNIRERFISSMAPSIYGMWHVKTAIALSIMGGQGKVAAGKHRIRGDINTLIVGDPGLAKSQFLKYIEQTFPRAVYTTGKGASAVGLTAACVRDEHGDWALQGGAMVLADSGICLIDEFDKMNDQDRTSIHEAMEQQTISISKAGIVATLQARCAVVAVANPIEGRYDPQRSFAQNVNLSDPILSRFDVLCVLKDEADPVQDESLADHVICSHRRSHPEATVEDKQVKPKLALKASHIQPIDQDLLQKYIVYCRQRVFPKVTDIDQDKLARFYAEIRDVASKSGGAPMTARHIESIIRLAEANARIELRQHVNDKDLDNAIGLMLESFIQSQKHQVAEELRKKFRHYIAQATPMADQFMGLFDKMFKEKLELLKLSRPHGVAPDISQVPLEMADVVRQIERYDLDIDSAHTFMNSERFRSNFFLMGEKLFRLG